MRLLLSSRRHESLVQLVDRIGCLPLRASSTHTIGAARNDLTSPRSRHRVAVGISGGVDSSVTALMLQRAGWDVVGVYMRNWDGSDEAGNSVCSTTEDEISARRVCDYLKIPLRVLDFSSEYWNSVFEPFLAAYGAGLTPNPDILCNRHVKFGAFRTAALSSGAHGLGCDAIATGHYAQLRPSINIGDPWGPFPAEHTATDAGSRGTFDGNIEVPPLPPPPPPTLLAAVDGLKDQSDFLAAVPGSALRRTLFPLGGLLKSEVRAIASDAGLPTATRRDSYGICFVGTRRRLSAFLASYMPLTPGRFIDIDTGSVVGTHDGAEAWTPGQGARIGGVDTRYFIVGSKMSDSPSAPSTPVSSSRAIDGTPERASAVRATRRQGFRGDVYVAAGRVHAALFCNQLVAAWTDMRWGGDGKPPQALAEAAAACTTRQDACPGVGIAHHRSIRVRYRIRHRQNCLGSASLRVTSRTAFVASQLAETHVAHAAAATQAAYGNDSNFLSTPPWSGLAKLRSTQILTAWGTDAEAATGTMANLTGGVVGLRDDAGIGIGGHIWGAGGISRVGTRSSSSSGQNQLQLRESGDDLLLVVDFDVPQRAVAPGQVIVFYDDERGNAGDANVNHVAVGGQDSTPLKQLAASGDKSALYALQLTRDSERESCQWSGAGRACLGCAPILAGGASHWEKRLPAPETWVE